MLHARMGLFRKGALWSKTATRSARSNGNANRRCCNRPLAGPRSTPANVSNSMANIARMTPCGAFASNSRASNRAETCPVIARFGCRDVRVASRQCARSAAAQSKLSMRPMRERKAATMPQPFGVGAQAGSGLTRTPQGIPHHTCGGGGPSRNRTGVHGFAIRCVTTPPSGLRRSIAWCERP